MRASGELDRADNRLLSLQRDLTKATTPRQFYDGRVAIGEILQIARERNRAGRIRMSTGYEGHNFLEQS